MNGEQILTAGALAAAVLELIKWVIRLIKKDPLYEFPVKFYLVMTPVLAYLCEIPLAMLGIGDYTIALTWEEFLKKLLVVTLSALMAAATHAAAIKGLSDKAKFRLLAQ